MFKRFLQFFILLGAMLCSQADAASILQLNPPGGGISGAPGTTVGWGFTLTNDIDYLVVTKASFGDSTSCCNPIPGFTDLISPQFVVVGPSPENTSVSQTFSLNNQTGIGSFAIDPNAIIGSILAGNIVLTYDLYSVSPNDQAFNPDTDTVAVGNNLKVDAYVTVTQSTVPIPAALWLCGPGLGLLPLLGVVRRRKS